MMPVGTVKKCTGEHPKRRSDPKAIGERTDSFLSSEEHESRIQGRAPLVLPRLRSATVSRFVL